LCGEQTKVERLQESNRVLTMELEEKRGLIEKINSLYKNIPQLLQVTSGPLSLFSLIRGGVSLEDSPVSLSSPVAHVAHL
jgi:hypothetical protein